MCGTEIAYGAGCGSTSAFATRTTCAALYNERVYNPYDGALPAMLYTTLSAMLYAITDATLSLFTFSHTTSATLLVLAQHMLRDARY
eukprot:3941329-Rhodomonas_salina.1